ncbi:MAG TPA: class I SAM-dependent methyltransferase [Candidatus Paceibacterota bacterium]|nr:class I SAM-dependent methyltransferase [Candidatus Paceibacterota bacterium]
MSENEWDSYAPTYDNEPDHGLSDPLIKQKWTELIVSQLPGKPIRIIDMGGGTGSITELLADAGHHVTYVDSSPEMAKLAKEKCQRFGNQIDYFTCSVKNLDKAILNSRFDVVFGRHILWATENLVSTLQAWHSLLSEHGYFVLVEGFWSTGAGITSGVLENAVKTEMGSASTFPLNDPIYWGKQIDDERYLIVSK